MNKCRLLFWKIHDLVFIRKKVNCNISEEKTNYSENQDDFSKECQVHYNKLTNIIEKLSKEYKSSDSNKSISINCIETLYISRIEKYFAIFTSNGILDLFYFDVDFNQFKMLYS